jgi:hypothetical protein
MYNAPLHQDGDPFTADVDDRKEVVMRVCLFEDRGALDLEPLTLTRPVFDLLCGLTPLAAKQSRFCPPGPRGVLVRPYLADLQQLASPALPVNDPGWLRGAPTVLVNGRWLPPSGSLLDTVTAADLAAPCTVGDTTAEAGRPGLAVVGPRARLAIHPTARVDPLVVADTTRGPVVVEAEAVVTAFTRLEGPCCVGPRTQVHGAKIRAGTTLGPDCRVGGEVEASILHGHSNKYHDGFLGHAYVGSWVNLGAGTQNSDLRNDYGEVTVTVNGRRVPTGLTKVGCFLGDHVKSGLGTLLNTGTNVGAFCNLLPGGLLPRYIPSFASWWDQALADRADLPALLRTAAEVMRRRNVAFTEAHAALYRTLFEQTAGRRRQAVREAEMKALRRKSA